jgi:hypothetical protein
MKQRMGGLLILVVVLAALNGLSYAFDWGWVFY